jgi:prepilin-type N-terminal cleavage/methylation domain-containing protein
MRKAFTLIEMVVALGILALILSFAGVIFRVSIESQRLALANAEVMQKYRTITTQLDEDLRGLCRDGEIFVIWSAVARPDFTDPNRRGPAVYDRFDRIMFFTSGDFQTYSVPVRRGNVARVCYALARGRSADPADANSPVWQKPQRRMLARTQHLLIPPARNSSTLDTSGFTDAQWQDWNSKTEVDRISLAEWKQIPWQEKVNMLSVIGDVNIIGPDGDSATGSTARGVLIDRADPDSLHVLLCEGVGQFAVQGWNDRRGRWMPEIDPNGDGDLDDSDFFLKDGTLDTVNCPGVWYPRGGLTMGGIPEYPWQDLDEDHFDRIPGLGRALKFTFTLYDRRGLLKQGRTFTHIVYLDI